jgi:hypothetical protein
MITNKINGTKAYVNPGGMYSRNTVNNVRRGI